jgi:hypothetical protein
MLTQQLPDIITELAQSDKSKVKETTQSCRADTDI